MTRSYSSHFAILWRESSVDVIDSATLIGTSKELGGGAQCFARESMPYRGESQTRFAEVLRFVGK